MPSAFASRGDHVTPRVRASARLDDSVTTYQTSLPPALPLKSGRVTVPAFAFSPTALFSSSRGAFCFDSAAPAASAASTAAIASEIAILIADSSRCGSLEFYERELAPGLRTPEESAKCERVVGVNRQVVLAARPEGFPKDSDFELVESPVPEPGAGEVLVQAQWLSVDPYMRGRMSTARSYAKATELGEPMTGQVVGEVAASNDSRFAPGDTVVGQLGWQDYAVARGGVLRKLDPSLAPPQTALHVFGTTGLTAYFGLFDVGKPKPGDTVVVSGAAGGVGQIVGQLARIAGCRTVVGLAGSAEKVADLKELYGYDVGIDYKADDVNAALKEACPDGVDVYFDNVGGGISETVFRRLALGARVPICGQISQYNLAEPELAPRNLGFLIVFRARLEGFLVNDYAHRFPEGLRRLGGWLAEGKLRYREDVTDGLENAPAAFMGMLRGENRGKALVRIR